MQTEDKDFKNRLVDKAAEIERVLKKFLPEEQGVPEMIVEAMNYSLLAGGKRLRPMLMQETYRMFGGEGVGIENFMAAMEMIHTYSLVHDDLPSMDHDEYRRGRKTTWAVYGEAMGVLTGDALLNYAFETATQALFDCRTTEDFERVRSALNILGFHAGIRGMIGGQVADVEAERKTENLTNEQVLYIHTHKTGALIKASMLIGAILAGASDAYRSDIAKCGTDIGVAFQIQDDILDVVGDSAELGKPVGSDAANGKQTYVTINGMEQSVAEVDRLSKEALDILRRLPGDHRFLEALVQYLIDRRS